MIAIVVLFNCLTTQPTRIIDNASMFDYGGQCAEVYTDGVDPKVTMDKIRTYFRNLPIKYIKIVGEDLEEKTQIEKDQADSDERNGK